MSVGEYAIVVTSFNFSDHIFILLFAVYQFPIYLNFISIFLCLYISLFSLILNFFCLGFQCAAC